MEKKDVKNKNHSRVDKNKNINTRPKTVSKIETKKNVIKVDESIKEDIKNENNSNKKVLIIFALILALCLGVFAYSKVKNNDETDDKDTPVEKEKDPIEKDDDEDEKITENEEKNYLIYVNKKEDKKINTEEPLIEDEEIFYSLTFNSNGGEEIEKQIVESKEATTPVSNPQRENGWRFAGWFLDSEFEEEFVFGGFLTEDTTVYAKWVKTIKFSVNDQLLDESFDAEVYDGEVIPLLTEEDLDDGILEENHVVAWFITINDVSFEVLNGTILSDETINIDDSEIILELNPLLEFDMNFHINGIDTPYTKTVVENRIIDFTDVNKYILTVDEEIDINTVGWYYQDGEIKMDFPSTKVATRSITDIYTSEVYVITYNEIELVDDEPVVNTIEKINYSKDSKINVLVPEEKENMEFDGWYTDIEDETTKIEDGYIITNDITVIGKWNEISEDEEEIPTLLVVPDDSPVNEEIPAEEDLSDIEEEKPINENLDSENDEEVSETEK